MIEIVERLDGAHADRVSTLRRERRFFWVDVSLETSAGALADALDLEELVAQTLVDFGEAATSSHNFYADGQQVVFGFGCYLEATSAAQDAQYRFVPLEVRLLVCGEYVLTLHREPGSLPERLAVQFAEERNRPYLSTPSSTRWWPADSTR